MAGHGNKSLGHDFSACAEDERTEKAKVMQLSQKALDGMSRVQPGEYVCIICVGFGVVRSAS